MHVPAIQAQLPTAPSTGAPTGPSTKAFRGAWLRIAIGGEPLKFAALPYAVTVETVLRTNRGERVMSSTRMTRRSQLAGKLPLSDLPTGVPFVLRISTHDRQGVVKTVYTDAYRLHLPEGVQVARIGYVAALEQAGFLGDFLIDPTTGTVRRTDK